MRTTDNFERKQKREQGFTTIELLIVVGIIGVLASISIPVFRSYQGRAADARAITDLRNGATAQSALYADTENFIACVDTTTCEAVLPGIQSFSVNTVLNFTATDPNEAFLGISESINGTGKSFTWDSLAGGLN